MRAFVISCCWLSLICWGGNSASAEAIHLKNGDVIYADQVREAGPNLEYEVGNNSYSIPRSKIQSVEAVPRPEVSQPPAFALPLPTPEAHDGDDPQLLTKIVHNGQVDRSALDRVEAVGNSRRTAVAFYIAARAEF